MASIPCLSSSLSNQGPFVSIVNIVQGKKYVTRCNRRVLVDFSGLVEEALQDIPATTKLVELMMPNPVNPTALAIVLEWMHKSHGQRPTKPIEVPVSDKTTFMKVMKVYQAVNEIQPKARAMTGKMYPWLLRYINEYPLTIEEVDAVIKTFTASSGVMHRMCHTIAERGSGVYADVMYHFNALRQSEPDFDVLLMQKLHALEKAGQTKAARQQSKISFTTLMDIPETRSGIYEGWGKVKVEQQNCAKMTAEDVAMARDGQRVLDDHEVEQVLKGSGGYRW